MQTNDQVPPRAPVPYARNLHSALILLLLFTLAGCATNHPRDPLEPLNRGIYAFNDGLDTVVMKPIAKGYRAVLPQFVRTGIGNFFSNLDDITVILNGILQLKIPQAVSDTGRFLLNSTVGILGLFDVATHFGLEKHNEDFGQTLGYWGMGSGPYLVLPFFGPSSVRDGIGRVVDIFSDPVFWIDHVRTRNQVWGVRVIDTRERLLDAEKLIDVGAIDRYDFVRNAYLQRRRNLVYDGNPPPEEEDEEPAKKPRSEAAPPLMTVLVDQFGNTIAGGEPVTGGIVPLLVESTSKAPPPQVENVQRVPTSAPREQSLAPAAAEPRPIAEAVQTVQSSNAPEATAPSRNGHAVVKVWLPTQPR